MGFVLSISLPERSVIATVLREQAVYSQRRSAAFSGGSGVSVTLRMK